MMKEIREVVFSMDGGIGIDQEENDGIFLE